jgi:hypothetical protein
MGLRKRVLKACLAAEEAGNEEFHQAPQLAEVVFDGRAGQAEPVAGIEFAGGLRDLGVRVLDVLRLVEHDQVEGVEAEFFDVAVEQGVGCEDEVGVGDRAVVFARSGPLSTSTRRSGVNLRPRRASWDDRGGGDDQRRAPREWPDFFSVRMWVRVCRVLPRPMSSARMPCSPWRARNCIQRKPAS